MAQNDYIFEPSENPRVKVHSLRPTKKKDRVAGFSMRIYCSLTLTSKLDALCAQYTNPHC